MHYSFPQPTEFVAHKSKDNTLTLYNAIYRPKGKKNLLSFYYLIG